MRPNYFVSDEEEVQTNAAGSNASALVPKEKVKIMHQAQLHFFESTVFNYINNTICETEEAGTKGFTDVYALDACSGGPCSFEKGVDNEGEPVDSKLLKLIKVITSKLIEYNHRGNKEELKVFMIITNTDQKNWVTDSLLNDFEKNFNNTGSGGLGYNLYFTLFNVLPTLEPVIIADAEGFIFYLFFFCFQNVSF